MATNFNPATKISVSGPLSISDKRSADMPLDIRGRIETLTDITTIPFAWEGMLVYVRDTKEYYKVTSLANRTVGGVAIPYYPATWVKFGSGGSTPSPSPTPFDIDAGDVTYSSGGTFSDGTVGKELQSLANDILGLAEDIRNLSGDIGTLSNLSTEYKDDLVGAINEVLTSTGSTIAVVNNLLSDSTTDALSAYQGKVLKGLVDGKVAGIKVQGESSVLPMANGIVTIPAGGGGTGTITGATVGGNPVTASGGILQFDAYPTVPITSIETSDHTPLAPNNGLVTLPAIPAAPTADTMQYSGSTNYSTGSIGKEVKTLNGNVNDLSTRVTDLEADKPSPTPSSSTTTVNLANYATSSSSFTYDVDNKYIYNTKDTTFYQYSEEDNNNTVYYGVFKVIGEDRYLMYKITNNTTFTYENTYTESTLPENAKKEFALGSVAVVKRVNGQGESWKNGTVNLFCTKQNMPLRNRCKNINFNGSTAWRVLIKSEDGNTIFVYKAKPNGNYEWEINVPRSSTTNFNLLDKYFDRPDASNVSFDDSITQLGTQEVPVTDVQAAINILTTAIASNTCITKIILKDYDGTFINNTHVYVSYILNGETVVISSNSNPTLTTDSNGEVTCNIPYGAIYTISFVSKTNRQKPADITQMAENIHITHQALYLLQADVEQINLQVQVRGANNASSEFNLTDRIVYIDYLNERYEVVVQAAMTCYLNARGNIVRVVDANNVETDTCLIPRGTTYKIRLSEWLNMVPSGDKIYTADRFTRSLVMYYSYTLSGLFVVVENYDINGNDLDTYTEYKCIDYDYNNSTVTIKDSQDVEWDVKYDSTEGILHAPHGTNTWGVWLDNTKLSRVLGIGVRSSATINNDIFDDTGAAGYTDCSFILTNNARTNSKWQNSNVLWNSHPQDLYSGRHNTNFMAISTEPESLLAKEAVARTLKTGNVVQTGFILAPYQARQLYLNKQDVLLLASVLHFTNGIQESWIDTIPTSAEKPSSSGRDYWAENVGSMSASVTMKNNNVITFVCFSF